MKFGYGGKFRKINKDAEDYLMVAKIGVAGLESRVKVDEDVVFLTCHAHSKSLVYARGVFFD